MPPRTIGSVVKVILSYILAIGGVVLVGLAILSAIERTLTYPDTRVRITNLLRTNANQAELVCKSMPGSFVAALAAAINAGAMVLGQPLATVVATTRPAYDGAAVGVNVAWKMLVGKGKLGALAAVGGVALQVMDGHWPIIPIILAVIAASGLGWLMLQHHEAERFLVLARAEILPEVDRVMVEKRYVPAA